ncbi:caM kinase-like vesicle-associated protein isoform X2 [Polyodon spathula]|uniref:caM kinase-like vesicle-associated protein isoform X2 n=1 Tax=Polyodon spathula TaxID=7913 RepID=UPI001B7E8308|nr:caM kinase-like vesicle-associated protein isoform X2 [Polyodon spathula]XP_041092917.1 caM kinase-like vesicle-associated protein isoform X2 [Polyodon spathula]
MPFGCLALREGRNYNSLSEITDKYEIGQVLRAKEFCELCLAKDRQTDKVFGCKKFIKKDGRKVRKAAKNEIMILKMINHPNILQLIDTFETKKEYFIIQELATGGDVFDWILDQGNYTERDASQVIKQVLEAVAYLHSLNIVHRNLKLENLMYYNHNNHNKVVLRDFYLSCFENGSVTEPCGTPEYLAPEVVARHRYGRPVDCWAVGVIMYILLSGNPPYYDETEEENTDLHNRFIFCKIVAGEFEFDSPYWDDISPAAKELVCQLMEVDQLLRISAQDALCHEWIAGDGASEKNLKDGVCAQIEKNFAKAKWRKAIRVATFMQRLRTPDSAGRGGSTHLTPRSSMSISHEVTIENLPEPSEKRQSHKPPAMLILSPSVGLSPTATMDNLRVHSKPPPLPPQPSPARPSLPEPKSKAAPGESSSWKMAAVLDRGRENKVPDQTKPSLARVLDRKEPKTAIAILDHKREEKTKGFRDHSERKAAPHQSQSKKIIVLDQGEDSKLHGVPGQTERKSPAALEQRKMAAVLDWREPGRTQDSGDKKSVSPLDQHRGVKACFELQDKTIMTDKAAVASILDQKPAVMVLDQDKWKMDTVIEQIEKQISDSRDSERERDYRHSVHDRSLSVPEQREGRVLDHRSPFPDRRQVLERGCGSRPSLPHLTTVTAVDSQEPITHEDDGADSDGSQSEKGHV